jgi:putative DNA primase/helicase
MVSLLGDQNISNVSLQRIAANRFATSSMLGKILNAYGDLDIESIEQTGMIKQIISHEHIMIEKKNRNAFSSKIPIRLLYSANRLPEFPNADDAIFRRFWVVKFPIVIPPEKRDIKLLEKLCTPEEKSGFMNILIENAHQIVKRDFKFTHYQDLEKTKQIWREKSDSISAFVEAEIVVSPNSMIKTTDMYGFYRKWCMENNEKISTDRLFFAKFEGYGPFTKGFAKIENKSTRVVRGATTRTIIKIEKEKEGQKQL